MWTYDIPAIDAVTIEARFFPSASLCYLMLTFVLRSSSSSLVFLFGNNIAPLAPSRTAMNFTLLFSDTKRASLRER
jgi:hypothetical protein